MTIRTTELGSEQTQAFRLGRPQRGLSHPWWGWVCAVAALALLVWPWPPHQSRGGSTWVAVAAVWALTTVTLVTAGWLLLRRPAQRRNGALMLALAVVTSVDTLEAVQPGPWQFLVFVHNPFATVLLAVLLLRWPGERLRTRVEIWAARYACGSLGVLVLLVALTWDPAWGGYRGPAWWPTLVRDRTLHDWVARVHLSNELLLLVVFLVLLGLRFRRAPRADLRSLIPVGVAAVALVGMAVGRVLSGFAGVFPSAGFLLLEYLAAMTVPLSVLVSIGIRRVQRALAVEALLAPGRIPDADGVRIAAARALGDRDLSLALWSPEQGHYVPPEGEPVDGVPRGRHSVEVTDGDGTRLARMDVDPRLAEDPELVDSVVRAAGVALANARLQADLRTRQQEAAESSRQLRRAQDTERSLSRLVPWGLPERLRADPEAMSGTERLTVTVLMSDVRGYGLIAETTGPADLARQLNEHRRAMNAEIAAQQGTVLQYVGDAVLAVFGAPRELPEHGEFALRAAMGMHRAQERLNAAWVDAGLPPFGIGIGISTGEVVAACLGSDDRAEYTVVGDTVNLAARLTDAARPAGTTLASTATLTAARRAWQMDQLPPLQVRGRTTPVAACRVVGPADLPPPPPGDPASDA